MVPLSHADNLLQNRCSALMVAGARLGFEAVIGVNGRVWLRVPADVPRKALVALSRVVIEAADCVTPGECESLVDKFFPPPAAPSGPPDADGVGSSATAGPIIGASGAAVALGAL